jgi:hypothetical protein
MLATTLATDVTNIADESNFHGKTFGRNQRSSFVQAQQPKTKPDDAFGIVGRCEHCRTMKPHRRGW